MTVKSKIKDALAGLVPKSEVDKALSLFAKASKKIEAAIARLEQARSVNNADREWTGDLYKDKIDAIETEQAKLDEKRIDVYAEWENFDEQCFAKAADIDNDIERLKRAKAQIETIIA